MYELGKIAVLGGAGMIGSAILRGMLDNGVVGTGDVVVTARHRKSLARVSDLGVEMSLDNAAAVATAQSVLLAVQPDQATGLLEACADSFREGQLLISVVTGVATLDLHRATGGRARVVRAMPNIATVVGASVTSLTAGASTTEEHIEAAIRVFEVVGTTVVLEERHLDACTGLAGCGPAFAFKVIESLAAGGVKMGLPRDVSRIMAAGVLLGAAKLVLETGEHPAELKDRVTTPGGCTIDGITKLEERGLPIAMIEAVEASTRKASRLRVNAGNHVRDNDINQT